MSTIKPKFLEHLYKEKFEAEDKKFEADTAYKNARPTIKNKEVAELYDSILKNRAIEADQRLFRADTAIRVYIETHAKPML